MFLSSNPHAPVVPPSAYASTVRDVRYHSIALLSALLWDALLTFDEEMQHIWSMRHRRPFKWVYFLLRYGVILAQTVHNILFEALSNGSNPHLLCYMWSFYIVASNQIVETLLEFILASRVYALYNRSRWISFLLLALILTEIGATVRTLQWLPSIEFYGTCILILTPKGIEVQSIIGFIVHCTLIGLTLFKYFRFRAGHGRSPLVSRVVRDSTTVYGTILFILVSVAIACNSDSRRGIVVALWGMSSMSVLGCHLILSMERLAKEMSIDSSQPIFTSKITLIALDSASAGSQNGPPSHIQSGSESLA